ncbi:MAG: DUF721 domain-containing protein [Planctomycetota bacterium]
MTHSPYEEEDLQDTHKLVQKRQRFQRRPKRTADLLGQLMARKGYNQVESQDELGNVWQEILDKQFHSKTRVSIVRSGVLEILVDSSAARQQLEFQKRQLVNELKKRLPKSNIKDIRFKVTKIR